MHTDAKKKKPRPKPKPTATPVPPTLLQVLTANAPHIAVSVSGQSIAWSPVSGAARYLVTVGPEGGRLAWATVTGSTHVIYGDVTVDGVADSSADGWPVAFPAGTIPSIVALDASGQVVALTLR